MQFHIMLTIIAISCSFLSFAWWWWCSETTKMFIQVWIKWHSAKH